MSSFFFIPVCPGLLAQEASFLVTPQFKPYSTQLIVMCTYKVPGNISLCISSNFQMFVLALFASYWQLGPISFPGVESFICILLWENIKHCQHSKYAVRKICLFLKIFNCIWEVCLKYLQLHPSCCLPVLVLVCVKPVLRPKSNTFSFTVHREFKCDWLISQGYFFPNYISNCGMK